jgi:hypothetical protein
MENLFTLTDHVAGKLFVAALKHEEPQATLAV